jgi:hypothetical protein
VRPAVFLLFASACGFTVSGGSPADDAPSDGASDAPTDAALDAMIDAPIDPPIDAPVDAPSFGDVDFLPPAEEYAASGNWAIGADTTIDTSNVAGTTPPAGAELVVGLQSNGSEVAILRARDFKVNGGKTLRVVGTRPLVIIADHDVSIDGTLDLGARTVTPGAGGSAPYGGMGVGGHGMAGGNNEDSGGGGGGFGGPGSIGGTGNNVAIGGSAGLTYAAANIVGGSSGGGPPQLTGCTNKGGAGGGAVLIYAKNKLDVKGMINAGGGGGEPGLQCANNYRSGAGGGSGGLIYLQTPNLTGDGNLVANGGGGGGGTCSNTSGGSQNATAGANGALNLAPGGTGRGDCGANGGSGATQAAAPTSGSQVRTNGGGGGGGLGRIIYRAPSIPGNLTSSPTAVPAP